MVNTRILVVDDEAAIRRAVRRVLERHHFDVLVAANGHEACAMLEAHTVDVILVDLHMPGMSGATLFHLIATQWPVLANRVVVMSGDVDASWDESWVSLNRLPLLLKPFQIHELLEMIKSVVPERLREANGH